MALVLIDVYSEELTLRVDDESITFKVGQTSRYSYNDVVLINRIDVIDVACEEYAQEVIEFLDSSTSDNPTPSLYPILQLSSPSLTNHPIEDCDWRPYSTPRIINNNPMHHFIPPKELNLKELKIVKSSIDDPPELELKDLPSHLEYGIYGGSVPRCHEAIFHDMIEETMEVFMDDFSVFRDSFSSCLSHLDKMLKRCEDTNLVLNWEKCYFMVKEGIVLGHKISKSGVEVDKAKVDVIAKLPHPNSVKGIRSF
ncbi:hypothetical protein Tco_0500160 [Tanacetum coccineum]